ncbi:MAG: Na+/H+ antiporter [Chloroflexi bacterium]|nr:MAG: Na+/H+ antiporter [Chloroflexota bacterium]
MLAAELLLALLVVVAVLVTISRRIRVPYPVLLLLGGLVVGLVPGIPRLELDPEIVFLVVLPPLLYVSAFLTPIRDFRTNLKNISSLAIGLVAVSAGVVAVIAMALVPGMSWPLAAALGAIVSPPDAVAATAIAQRLAVPRRIVSILEGESLLNDATALTIYRAAIGAAVAAVAVSVVGSLGSFVFVAVGGILIGLAIGWVTSWVRIHLTDTPVEITVSLITPYAAYLPAELLGVSGVLAAVTAGLFLGRRSSRIMGSEARLAGRAVWESLVFLLTGVVFLAIGFQISSISRQMDRTTLLQLAAVGVLVSLALVAVRAVWVFTLSLRDLLVKDQRRIRLRESIVLSWAGMRGVVSLAAALAIPITLPGSALPARDAIIIITFTVILVTLVGQGLTLPLVIRAVGLGGDADDGHEESHARRELIDEALRRIDDLEKKWPDHKPLIDQLRTGYQHRAEHEEQLHEAPGNEAEQELVEHRQIRSDVIDAQRDALAAMRDRGAIDDDVMRNIERELDLEEIRMEA